MTNRNPIPPGAVLVALDIAKLRNEVLIEMPGQQRRRRLSVLNNRTEHDRLIDILQAFDAPVVCAFEATGNYHRPIAWRLMEAGFDTRLVSSMALARTREALHNGWDKNDPRDAQVILHMLRIGGAQAYHDPMKAGINDVQELSKTPEAIALNMIDNLDARLEMIAAAYIKQPEIAPGIHERVRTLNTSPVKPLPIWP